MPGSLFNTFNYETVQSSNFNLCVVASDDPKITDYDTCCFSYWELKV